MTYSKYFFPRDQTIPTPLMILVVLLLIFFLARLFGSASLPSRATKKIIKNLTITSPSQNQVGVFWQTDEKETGWVIFADNETNLERIALDERDLQDKKNLYYNHLSILKDLQPSTIYYYKIVSNNQLVEANEGKPFSFRTPFNLSLNSNLNPAYGKVIKENGEPLVNAFVILSFAKAYPLVTLSKTTGEWLVPLNTILSRESLKVQNVSGEDTLSIEVIDENREKTQINTKVSRVSPLPQTIILGKDYDFLSSDDVLSVNTGRATDGQKIEILFPRESAVIPGGKPLIKGTAIPGNQVEVTIESEKSYTFKTTADRQGVWSVVLTDVISPGSHTLKVKTKDANGKDLLLTRKFTIAKSGELVLGEATAEATPTFIPPASPLPTLSPTIIITPYMTQSVTISSTPPTSGINIIPVSMASVSLIILGLGFLLAF